MRTPVRPQSINGSAPLGLLRQCARVAGSGEPSAVRPVEKPPGFDGATRRQHPHNARVGENTHLSVLNPLTRKNSQGKEQCPGGGVWPIAADSSLVSSSNADGRNHDRMISRGTRHVPISTSQGRQANYPLGVSPRRFKSCPGRSQFREEKQTVRSANRLERFAFSPRSLVSDPAPGAPSLPEYSQITDLVRT